MQSFTQMPADETLDLAVTRLNNNLNTLVSNNSGTSAPSSPVAGELFYNTSTNKLYRYSGTAWVEATDVTVSTSGSGNAVTDISASGGALTVTKGSTFLTSHQDISGKINTTGDRGSLAGYESVYTTINTDITASSHDVTYINEVEPIIEVSNGSSGTSWTKLVSLPSDSSVTMGSNWSWVGGSAPTISGGDILVLCWCYNKGRAGVLSAS